MNIKEALIAAIALPDLDDNELEKALTDNDLSADSTYQKTDKQKVDIAAISVLRSRLHIAGTSEGSLSMSYSVQGLKDRIISLATENGLTQLVAQMKGTPKIQRIRRW